MSFITCCPACGTKFRVVADQLRISDGWVRCGRCQEVFDAQAALQPVVASAPETMAQDAPAPASSTLVAPRTTTLPESHVTEPSPGTQLPASVAPDVVAAALDEGIGPDAAHALPEPEVPLPQVAGYELPVPPEPEDEGPTIMLELPEDWPPSRQGPTNWHTPSQRQARTETVLPSSQAAAAAASETTNATSAAMKLDTAALDWNPQVALPAEEAQALAWAESAGMAQSPHLGTQPDVRQPAQEQAPEPQWQASANMQAPEDDLPINGAELPSFVKQAHRKAWWSQPAVRFVMGMLLILLPLALLLQIVVHERNRIAAWQPQWRTHLETMCVALRCEVGPYQDMASVVLTGSAFVQDERPYHYKLDLSIQNQSALAVATPALELTLTDTQDQVLVRKVLQPAEFGAPATLAARSEWNGTLPVMTQGLNLPVAGYRVMAFYP